MPFSRATTESYGPLYGAGLAP